MLSTRWHLVMVGFVSASLLVAAGCGGNATSASKTALSSQSSGGAPSNSSAASAKGGGSPAAAPAGAVSGQDAIFARGKLIYEKEAGGVGCAACHGMDGRGNGPAGVNAPANRGASEALIREKLGSVELMRVVKLNDDDIKAVAAYLEWLGKQP